MNRLNRIVYAVLLSLACGLTANVAQGQTLATFEPAAVETGFRLPGSHGYLISATAYSGGETKGLLEILVSGNGGAVSYRFPARVTVDAIQADLGSLGRVDVVRRASGLEKTVRPKCLGGKQTYEPGTYEGLIEFNGEEGYTQAKASRVEQLPAWLVLTEHGSCGSGYGETSGPGEHGARLRGTSYAGGRSLSFQVNKNGPRARTVFTASIKERSDGIRIYRTLSGAAPPKAFRFDHLLHTATLRPPAPFSGSASLARSKDSFSPLWTGDLRLDFPGRSGVTLAGAGVHVTIVHAHFTRSDSPNVKVGF